MVMTPRSYQQEAIDKFTTFKKPRLPLFWQMRLGKSATSIWCLQKYFEHDWKQRKHLFLCPKSVIVSWQEEFQKHNIHPLVFSSSPAAKEMQDIIYQTGNFFIANYEYMLGRGEPNPLMFEHWDSVVMDESSGLRNHKTNRSQWFTAPEAFPYKRDDGKKQYRACLSGTPAPESMLDYYQQMKFLYGRWGDYKDFYEFKDACFRPDDERGSSKWVPKYEFVKAFAAFSAKHCCVLTRAEAGVNIPNIYEKRFVEMSPENKAVYKEFEINWFTDFMKQFLQSGNDLTNFKQLEAQFAVAAQNYLHQLACGYPKRIPEFSADHKYKELRDLLTTDLKDEKVVVWCRYSREINELSARLEKEGRTCVQLVGGLSNFELGKRMERFRKDGGQRGAADTCFCNIRKASMGMDLSAADTQIFFSRSWSSNENVQALDRLIAVGKKEDGILTIDLITEDTIDEDLYWKLIDKKTNASMYKLFLKRTNLSDMAQSFLHKMSV